MTRSSRQTIEVRSTSGNASRGHGSSRGAADWARSLDDRPRRVRGGAVVVEAADRRLRVGPVRGSVVTQQCVPDEAGNVDVLRRVAVGDASRPASGRAQRGRRGAGAAGDGPRAGSSSPPSSARRGSRRRRLPRRASATSSAYRLRPASGSSMGRSIATERRPRASSSPSSRSQHQAPCQEPCTSANVAIAASEGRAGCPRGRRARDRARGSGMWSSGTGPSASTNVTPSAEWSSCSTPRLTTHTSPGAHLRRLLADRHRRPSRRGSASPARCARGCGARRSSRPRR